LIITSAQYLTYKFSEIRSKQDKLKPTTIRYRGIALSSLQHRAASIGYKRQKLSKSIRVGIVMTMNNEDEDEDNLVDTEAASGVESQGTFRERAIEDIQTLRDFCEGVPAAVRLPSSVSGVGAGRGNVHAIFERSSGPRTALELDERIDWDRSMASMEFQQISMWMGMGSSFLGGQEYS
jgi:hypothetical protein